MSFTLVKKINGYIKQLVVNVDSETNKYSYLFTMYRKQGRLLCVTQYYLYNLPVISMLLSFYTSMFMY